MKRFSIISGFLISLFLISNKGYSQIPTKVEGTIINQGSNVVEVFGRPNDNTINGRLFLGINIAVSIADKGVNNPTNAQITATSLIPNLTITPDPGNPFIVSGRAYYSYLLNDNGVTTTTTWAANTDNGIMSLTFPSDPNTLSMRLDDLSPDGGPNGQLYWYVSLIYAGGGDATDYSTMFYGTGAVNNSGIFASYVPLQFPVPVKFTTFAATKNDDAAILSWAVQNESLSHYEIERSFNGVDFTKVTSIQAKSTGNFISSTYSYTDNNLSSLKSSGVIYYRIKEVDQDGKVTYTEIKSVRLTGRGIIIGAYPNPAKSDISITADLTEDSKLSIVLSDATGKQVKQLITNGAKGINVSKLSMEGLASGSYMLKVSTGSEIKTLPIIKE